MENANDLLNSKIKQDVRISMCFGLVGRIANTVSNNRRIHADDALNCIKTVKRKYYCIYRVHSLMENGKWKDQLKKIK